MKSDSPLAADAVPLDDEAQRLEQQLQRVRPRPSALSAAEILAAAESTSQIGAPISGGTLGIVAASWTCGTVMGIAVTCLVLLWGNDSVSPPSGDQRSTDRVAKPNTIQSSGESQSVPVRSRWSKSDWLVAAQLKKLNRPEPIAGGPLIAGAYGRLGTVYEQFVATVDPANGAGNFDRQPQEASVDGNVVPSPGKSHRRQLFQELLDIRP